MSSGIGNRNTSLQYLSPASRCYRRCQYYQHKLTQSRFELLRCIKMGAMPRR